MGLGTIDIAIIGAGPYGLSLAAHLRPLGKRYRIFGPPMRFWSNHMPRGMCLKSEGFASDLYEPASEFTLKFYCGQNGVDYQDIGLPVKIDTFIAYALEFQRRFVPMLEDTQITAVTESAGGFELTTQEGETLTARKVVIATGIMNFAFMPSVLAGIPEALVTHSSHHSDLSRFKGQHVAVLGAGASAVDVAGLLHQSGAEVDLIARRKAIAFHSPPDEPRPLMERLRRPRSGLGTGWRSRMCTDLPLVFHAVPESLRLRIVSRHLGPAPGWFVRDMVEGRVQTHLDATLTSAEVRQGKVRLSYTEAGTHAGYIDVDHVIAGTGYQVDISRLGFMSEAIRKRVDQIEKTPILNRHFESSVPGLHFIGAAAANSFGPLLRFAFGAKFAANQLARRLARA